MKYLAVYFVKSIFFCTTFSLFLLSNVVLTSISIISTPNLAQGNSIQNNELVDLTMATITSGRQKDANSINLKSLVCLVIPAQNLSLQADRLGNQLAVTNWFNTHGGATTSSSCSNLTWTYDFNLTLDDTANDSAIIYFATFTVTDEFGNTESTSATLIIDGVNHFNFQFYGTGDTICEDTYDLNSAIIGIEPTADLTLPGITYQFSRVSGPIGAAFSNTIVDFPDTGAGSYSYVFKVEIINDVKVYLPQTGVFSSLPLQEEAFVSINDKTVAFQTEELGTVRVCPGEISSIQNLTDRLVIFPDPIALPPQFPTNFNQYWTPSEYTGPGIYVFDPRDAFPNCPSNFISVNVNEESHSSLNLKVFLQGAMLNPNVGQENLMRDDLRVLGFLPTLTPYSDLKTVNSSILQTTGNNAIVDWVLVELRDEFNNAQVVYSTSALLKRDGNITDVDGVSPVTSILPDGNYYIVVKHRNHLGVMSSQPIELLTCTASPYNLNFADGSLVAFGSNAQVILNSGIKALWAGDVNGDGQVRYLGPNNDTNFIKNTVVNETGNNTNSNFYPFSGYNPSDIDMNGQIRYLGPGNDTNILKFIVLGHPSNGTLSNFFPFLSQIPNQP